MNKISSFKEMDILFEGTKLLLELGQWTTDNGQWTMDILHGGLSEFSNFHKI
jgi:hypothetical protein